MKKILFIGSYLSKDYGSKPVSQSVSEFLAGRVDVELRSAYSNKLARILDILCAVIFHRYDVVHFDIFSGKAILVARIAAHIARLKKRKVLFTLHGGGLADYHGAHPQMLERAFHSADVLLSPSLFLKQYFAEHDFTIKHLPNPINLEAFPFSEKGDLSYKLLWVRAFAPVYQPELAIDVLHAVLEIYPKATLTMIGPDHGELALCWNRAQEYGISAQVQFLGPVANSALSQYYSSHDVYLNTTRYESFGMALMEAAACGIPIVSTAVGEIPLLWKHGDDILMCEDGSARNFRDAISLLFENRPLAGTIINAARNKVEQYTWQQIAPIWLELIGLPANSPNIKKCRNDGNH